MMNLPRSFNTARVAKIPPNNGKRTPGVGFKYSSMPRVFVSPEVKKIIEGKIKTWNKQRKVEEHTIELSYSYVCLEPKGQKKKPGYYITCNLGIDFIVLKEILTSLDRKTQDDIIIYPVV